MKQKIAYSKREKIISEKETSIIPDMKKETYLLERELLDQRQKKKLLLEELEKPMNIHRWRKIEVTEPEIYEMI